MAAQLGAAAVVVVVDATHMCMVARGVENHAGRTATLAARGAAAADAALRRRGVLACARECSPAGGGGGRGASRP